MFKRIEAASEMGQKLAEQLVETSGRTNYNEVAREYNATAVGDYLIFPWNRDKASTLVHQLAARSLVRDGDYTIAFHNVKDVEHVAVKRVSETVATFVQAAKRGPRKAAAPAADSKPAPAADSKPAKAK